MLFVVVVVCFVFLCLFPPCSRMVVGLCSCFVFSVFYFLCLFAGVFVLSVFLSVVVGLLSLLFSLFLTVFVCFCSFSFLCLVVVVSCCMFGICVLSWC